MATRFTLDVWNNMPDRVKNSYPKDQWPLEAGGTPSAPVTKTVTAAPVVQSAPPPTPMLNMNAPLTPTLNLNAPAPAATPSRITLAVWNTMPETAKNSIPKDQWPLEVSTTPTKTVTAAPVVQSAPITPTVLTPTAPTIKIAAETPAPASTGLAKSAPASSTPAPTPAAAPTRISLAVWNQMPETAKSTIPKDQWPFEVGGSGTAPATPAPTPVAAPTIQSTPTRMTIETWNSMPDAAKSTIPDNQRPAGVGPVNVQTPPAPVVTPPLPALTMVSPNKSRITSNPAVTGSYTTPSGTTPGTVQYDAIHGGTSQAMYDSNGNRVSINEQTGEYYVNDPLTRGTVTPTTKTVTAEQITNTPVMTPKINVTQGTQGYTNTQTSAFTPIAEAATISAPFTPSLYVPDIAGTGTNTTPTTGAVGLNPKPQINLSKWVEPTMPTSTATTPTASTTSTSNAGNAESIRLAALSKLLEQQYAPSTSTSNNQFQFTPTTAVNYTPAKIPRESTETTTYDTNYTKPTMPYVPTTSAAPKSTTQAVQAPTQDLASTTSAKNTFQSTQNNSIMTPAPTVQKTTQTPLTLGQQASAKNTETLGGGYTPQALPTAPKAQTATTTGPAVTIAPAPKTTNATPPVAQQGPKVQGYTNTPTAVGSTASIEDPAIGSAEWIAAENTKAQAAKEQTPTTTPNPYDLMRQKVQAQTTGENQQMQEAIQRRLAAQGMTRGSGLLEEQQRLQDISNQQQLGSRLGDINIQELTAQQQSAEAEKGRQFQAQQQAESQAYTTREAERARAWTANQAATQASNSAIQADADRSLQREIQQGNLTIAEKQLAMDAAQFDTKTAYDVYALQAGLTDAERDRAWNANQNSIIRATQVNQADLDRALTWATSQAGLTLDQQKLAEQARQFNTEAEFKTWSAQQGFKQQDVQRSWDAWQNAESRAVETRKSDLDRQTTILLANQELTQRDKELGQEAWKFTNEQDFQKYALQAGFANDEADRAWKGSQAAADRLQQDKNEGANRQLQRDFQQGTINQQQMELAQNALQFDTKVKYDAWALQKGFDQKTADNAWQSMDNAREREAENTRILTSANSQKEIESMKYNLESQRMSFADAITDVNNALKIRLDAAYNSGKGNLALPANATSIEVDAYNAGKSGMAVEDYDFQQKVQLDRLAAITATLDPDAKTIVDEIDKLYQTTFPSQTFQTVKFS